jgi:hypothetical protein
MDNLLEEFEQALLGNNESWDNIEFISINPDYYATKGKEISIEEFKTILNVEVGSFSHPDIPSFFVWTNEYVYFWTNRDNGWDFDSVPRNPTSEVKPCTFGD